MIWLEVNIQNAVMVPRIPHIPNKNGSIDRLGTDSIISRVLLSKYHTSSGNRAFDERFL
jgi:hypothetical protein